MPLVPDGATWLLAKKVAVEKAREAAYNAATTPKECFKSEDFIQKNSEWSPLRDKSYRDILDRESALLRRCRVFVGARVTVVQNTTTDGQEVLNGASGTVVAFCDTHVRVTFDDGRTLRVGRESSIDISYQGVPLRRQQFPLELAVATTIHDIQGATIAILATYLDDNPDHLLWSRTMLFTLLTRAESLSGIYIVGYDEGVLRGLLQHRTSWHAEVDDWIRQRNVFAHLHENSHATSDDPLGDLAFHQPEGAIFYPRGTNVAYHIESVGTGEIYPGSTNYMARRIRQHNGQLSPPTLQTRHRRERQFVHIIQGFPPGGDGRRLARWFETELQQRAFRGADRLERELLARTLAAEWGRAGRANLTVDVVPE